MPLPQKETEREIGIGQFSFWGALIFSFVTAQVTVEMGELQFISERNERINTC